MRRRRRQPPLFASTYLFVPMAPILCVMVSACVGVDRAYFSRDWFERYRNNFIMVSCDDGV